MFEFRGGQTFGEASTNVRVDGPTRVGTDRKRQMDKPFRAPVQRARVAERGSQLLKRSPHLGVFLGDEVRHRRQSDLGIL
jgi:hypothetical protein